MVRAFVIVTLAGCTGFSGGGGGTTRDPGSAKPPPPSHSWIERVRIPEHMERPGAEVEAAIAGAVERLSTDEFADFSRASRALIGMGEAIVPYLGHVGERENDPQRMTLVITVILKPVLSEASSENVGHWIASSYRTVRVAAASVTGERRLTEHAGKLVTLLEDPELTVRRAGIVALRMISNRFYGYRANGPAGVRARAVARWREMWSAG